MEKKISVNGKIAFVSGSNRGIGKAITIELLEQGAAKVYAGARNIASLDELKQKYGARLVPVALNVTDDQSIEAAAEIANDVEILINNAGVYAIGNFLGGNLLESLKTNLDVNLWGVVKVTNAFLKAIMKHKAGAIINVSSVVGLANAPATLAYSISKAAIHSLTQGLRGELKETNILVSGVYPGPIDTDMTAGYPMDMETPENVAKEILQGMADGVEDIFPDPMSKQIGQAYSMSPKTVEQQFS
ncbi:MAG: SDR family oxidoreductase [Chitinophagales bacterium]|nr:SDR family oxidoreductase [Chitinophagales bacterium]